MFADPSSVTLSGTAVPLARVRTDGFASDYQSADGSVRLHVEHTTANNGRKRHVVRIDQDKVAANPLTGLSTVQSGSVTFTINVPGYGFAAADDLALFKALMTFLTDANVTRIVGGES